MVSVLITGANGQVGNELLKQAPRGVTALGYNSQRLDITDKKQVNQIVAEQSPSLIINAAAYTAVDKAETDTKNAFAVNETGVKNLANVAARYHIPLFHISTDYVFDGTASSPYKETDNVSPIGVYGRSKHAGEQALTESGIPHLILRTSWVFGINGGNFVKTMLRLASECDVLSIVKDQQGAPTSAASIADVLWCFARQYFRTGSIASGIYHFSNQPETTWYGFASEIFSQAHGIGLLEKQPLVQGITTSEYPTPAKRPLNSRFDCTKIQRSLSIEIPQWQSELSKMLKKLKNEP